MDATIARLSVNKIKYQKSKSGSTIKQYRETGPSLMTDGQNDDNSAPLIITFANVCLCITEYN